MLKDSKEPPRRERMDIRDVARQAKVSIATASRALNRVPTVSPQLARRVWKAADDLNYLPNTQARSLVSGRSHLLGLIVSEITNPFFPELIQQFENLAVQRGYEILIGSTNYDPVRMRLCVRRMLERSADGVAIMTFGIEQPIVQELAERNVPLVLVDAAPDLPHVSSLVVDYQTGIQQGVQHLAQIGHRRIAFISGPLKQLSARARQEAFVNSMLEAGLRPRQKWLIEGDHTLDGGMLAMDRLLEQGEMPSAVMCSNDMTAIGVLHTLYERNLRVPDDLSVIGFDNVQISAFTLPPLTTVEMSCADLARSAVDALRLKVDGPSPGNESGVPVIPTKLVVRRSTAPPRDSE